MTTTILFDKFKKDYMSRPDDFVPVSIENYKDTDNRVYKTAFTINLINRKNLSDGVKIFELLNLTHEQRRELNLFVVCSTTSLIGDLQRPIVIPTLIGYQEWTEDENGEWEGLGWFDEYDKSIPEGYELELVLDFDKHGHHIKAEFIKK